MYDFEYETKGGMIIEMQADTTIGYEDHCVGCDLPCIHCGGSTVIEDIEFYTKKNVKIPYKSKRWEHIKTYFMKHHEERVIEEYSNDEPDCDDRDDYDDHYDNPADDYVN
jgi:hypothetical protein